MGFFSPHFSAGELVYYFCLCHVYDTFLFRNGYKCVERVQSKPMQSIQLPPHCIFIFITSDFMLLSPSAHLVLELKKRRWRVKCDGFVWRREQQRARVLFYETTSENTGDLSNRNTALVMMCSVFVNHIWLCMQVNDNKQIFGSISPMFTSATIWKYNFDCMQAGRDMENVDLIYKHRQCNYDE